MNDNGVNPMEVDRLAAKIHRAADRHMDKHNMETRVCALLSVAVHVIRTDYNCSDAEALAVLRMVVNESATKPLSSVQAAG
ncbi:MAG: hypothetical protein QM667_07735 [Asticcacaulis sp.]